MHVGLGPTFGQVDDIDRISPSPTVIQHDLEKRIRFENALFEVRRAAPVAAMSLILLLILWMAL